MAGPGGTLEQLTKRVSERILGAELTHYLGYEKGQAPGPEDKKHKNNRNGTSKKTLLSEEGKLEIEVPRDRNGDFEPRFIAKGQRRFGGFDQKGGGDGGIVLGRAAHGEAPCHCASSRRLKPSARPASSPSIKRVR